MSLASRLARPLQFLERRQLAGYLLAISVGAVLGASLEGAAALAVAVSPALGLLLYTTFLGIPLHRPPGGWGDRKFLLALLTLNFVLVPLLAWALSRGVSADAGLQLGMLLVLLCPCIDYVIVFAALAGARHDKLLAATPLLMVLQLLLLPGYLYLMTDAPALIDAKPFVLALVGLILLPLGAAWVTQRAARRHRGARRLWRVGTGSMVPLMLLVLFLVVASQTPRVLAAGTALWSVVPLYVGFLLAAVGLGLVSAKLFRLRPRTARSLVFSGATRNSLVVLPLALALTAGMGLAPAAVVTQTLVELLGMVLLVWLVPRLLPRHPRKRRWPRVGPPQA